MDAWEQMGYFTYKARLRQEINNDWVDINHDIWVSLLVSFCFCAVAVHLCSNVTGQIGRAHV